MYDHKEEEEEEEEEEESQWNPVIFVCYFLAWNPQTKKPQHYGGEYTSLKRGNGYDHKTL